MPAMSATTAGASDARRLLAYGFLGLPLAFAALPIYVHVPRYYADSAGVPLALLGALQQIALRLRGDVGGVLDLANIVGQQGTRQAGFANIGVRQQAPLNALLVGAVCSCSGGGIGCGDNGGGVFCGHIVSGSFRRWRRPPAGRGSRIAGQTLATARCALACAGARRRCAGRSRCSRAKAGLARPGGGAAGIPGPQLRG